MAVEVAVRAHQGAREGQEDSVGVVLGPGAAHINTLVETAAPNLLLAVCDGVGGQAGGEVASMLAVTRFLAVARAGHVPVRRRLEMGARAALESLQQVITLSPDLAQMATTVLGVIVDGQKLSWVSVGDSPLWLVSNRCLLRLNEDHSGAARVVKRRLREPQVFPTDLSHVISHALSAEPLDHMDLAPAPVLLAPDDVVIAASDGLDSLSRASLLAAARKSSAGAIADALINAVIALKRPHQDNTTIAVLRVTGGLQRAAAGRASDGSR